MFSILQDELNNILNITLFIAALHQMSAFFTKGRADLTTSALRGAKLRGNLMHQR
jgi:hypothetical protein